MLDHAVLDAHWEKSAARQRPRLSAAISLPSWTARGVIEPHAAEIAKAVGFKRGKRL